MFCLDGHQCLAQQRAETCDQEVGVDWDNRCHGHLWDSLRDHQDARHLGVGGPGGILYVDVGGGHIGEPLLLDDHLHLHPTGTVVRLGPPYRLQAS